MNCSNQLLRKIRALKNENDALTPEMLKSMNDSVEVYLRWREAEYELIESESSGTS
jgi:hypothetical protein